MFYIFGENQSLGKDVWYNLIIKLEIYDKCIIFGPYQLLILGKGIIMKQNIDIQLEAEQKSCCFLDCLKVKFQQPSKTRKSLRKKLNLMILNNDYQKLVANFQNEQIQHIKFTEESNLKNSINKTQTQKGKTKTRIQSLQPSPQPIKQSSPFKKITRPALKLPSSKRHRSQSLEVKHPPGIHNLVRSFRCTQSSSTNASRQPSRHNNLMCQNIYQTIYEAQNSSLEYSKQVIPNKYYSSQFVKICKQVDCSIYFGSQINIPNQSLESMQFLKRLPSSQLPHEYAVSKVDISSSMLEGESEVIISDRQENTGGFLLHLL